MLDAILRLMLRGNQRRSPAVVSGSALVMPPQNPVLSGPFLRAAVTNFLFFSNLASFNLLPLYIKHLGGTEADIGLIMGVYNGTAIFCQPLLGKWVDRLGRRPFMLLGAGLAGASSLVFALTSALGPLFALLRFLQGIAFSAFFLANYTHIVHLVPAERRGWALGIFGMSGLLSGAVAPLLGEHLVRNLGYRVFFAETLVLALLALVMVLGIREPRAPSRIRAQGPRALAADLQEVLRLHMAVAFFFGLGQGTVFTFVPTFAESLGVLNLSLFYTAYAGCALLIRMVGGEWIDRLGRRAVIIPSMLVQTVGSLILALLGFLASVRGTSALGFLLLAGLLTGAAHGLLYPALSALVVDRTPEGERGRALAIYSSVVLCGSTLGAGAFGYVAHELGYGVMFGILTVLLTTGFAISYRLR